MSRIMFNKLNSHNLLNQLLVTSSFYSFYHVFRKKKIKITCSIINQTFHCVTKQIALKLIIHAKSKSALGN